MKAAFQPCHQKEMRRSHADGDCPRRWRGTSGWVARPDLQWHDIKLLYIASLAKEPGITIQTTIIRNRDRENSSIDRTLGTKHKSGSTSGTPVERPRCLASCDPSRSTCRWTATADKKQPGCRLGRLTDDLNRSQTLCIIY